MLMVLVKVFARSVKSLKKWVNAIKLDLLRLVQISAKKYALLMQRNQQNEFILHLRKSKVNVLVLKNSKWKFN